MKTTLMHVAAAIAVLTLSSWQPAHAQSWIINGYRVTWVISGNMVVKYTVPGTNNNFALGFITNNSLRMPLTTAGDFGVGTSSPAARLKVMRSSGPSNIARF